MLKRSFWFLPKVCDRITLVAILAVCLAFIPARSQNKTPQQKAEEDDIIKVNSNLVSLDVIVKDKKGKVVRDLKPEDFIVSENGVQQNIEFFDAPLTAATPIEKIATTPVTSEPRVTPTVLPRNVVALVLDGQSTEAANLKPVREGLIKYVKDRIDNNDSVALFAIAGGLQLIQPFTQDKEKLISAVERTTNISTQAKTAERREMSETIDRLRDQQLTQGTTGSITTPAGGSAAAQAMITRRVLEQFLQLRSALSLQQTRPVLAALAAICEGLRPMPGKKTLVMFSQGFVAPEVLDWQVQSTIDLANRANVSIYIIDATGLRGGVPQSGALVPGSALSGISAAVDQESRIRASAGESIFDITRHEGINRQQDLLFRLSEDTGGHFMKNTNDFSAGLNRIDDEIRSRYTLAYRTTDQNFDGNFRKVKIEVRRSDVNVVSRNGYYAIPPSQVVPLSPEDRKLMANFAALESHSTLPLSLELHPFRSAEGLYMVPVLIDIPPKSVTVDEKGGKRRLQLEVLGLVRAEGNDRILTRLGGNFNIELNPEQYELIINDKIFYRQDLELQAGNYAIDFIVIDRLSGNAAARREKLTLPEVDTDFSSTEPVLSRHATTVIPSLAKTTDVFTVGSVQIRPSPSRQFRATDNLIIFFRLYNAATKADTGKPFVKITVNLMRDGQIATKPFDFELTQPVKDPVPHLSFAKFVKLTGLTPGKYKAVIESLDTVKQTRVTKEASFEIVP